MEYSEEDKLYHGKLLYIRDLIMYRGKDLGDLEKDFVETVDFYLDEMGGPEKLFKTQLHYRGYNGSIKHRMKDNSYHGKLLNIADGLVMYEGNTFEELEKNFRDMVEFYIENLEKEKNTK